jgi:hypothetical protein
VFINHLCKCSFEIFTYHQTRKCCVLSI